MELNIEQMNYEEANQISNWIYEEPYAIYSMDQSAECINELLNGDYYSVTDIDNNLIGYFCFGKSAQVPVGNQFGVYEMDNITDVGLGIKPDLCGQGFGEDFIKKGLDFAQHKRSSIRFRLTVASFNQRAIKVYQRVGFTKVNSFKRISENIETEFEVMILN
jgi:RimJ/RimL family protein N-acetyltransferase